MRVAVTHGSRGFRSWTWWNLESGEPLASISIDYDGDGGHTVIHRRCPSPVVEDVVDSLMQVRDGCDITVTHQVTQWPRSGMPIRFTSIPERGHDE